MQQQQQQQAPPPPQLPYLSDAMLDEGYYLIPSVDELRGRSVASLRCTEGFSVCREGVGRITWDVPIDVTSVGELEDKVYIGELGESTGFLLYHQHQQQHQQGGDAVAAAAAAVASFTPPGRSRPLAPRPPPGVGLNRPCTVTQCDLFFEEGEGEREEEELRKALLGASASAHHHHHHHSSGGTATTSTKRGEYEALLKQAVQGIPGAVWGGYNSSTGELSYRLREWVE